MNALYEKARGISQVLASLAAEVDRKGTYDPRILAELVSAGLIAPTAPREFGGPGLGETALFDIMEEISFANTSAASMITNQLAAINALLVAREQQGLEPSIVERLQQLSNGERIGTLAITEAVAGSDAAAIETSAVRRGNTYVLNGEKHLISFHGIADDYLVFAKTDPQARHRGISVFLVDRKNPGLRLHSPIQKMGQRGMPTGALTLIECEVPLEARIGEEGQGFYIAMQVLNRMRIAVSAQAVGVARAAYEAAIRYARQRKTFGKPIGEHQAIAFKLADMAIGLEAARLMGQRAARLFDEGKDYVMAASMAKVYATEVARSIVNDALQIHGGNGYTTAFPVERYYRDQRVMELYAGTSEIQRLIIARKILQDAGSTASGV